MFRGFYCHDMDHCLKIASDQVVKRAIYMVEVVGVVFVVLFVGLFVAAIRFLGNIVVRRLTVSRMRLNE